MNAWPAVGSEWVCRRRRHRKLRVMVLSCNGHSVRFRYLGKSPSQQSDRPSALPLAVFCMSFEAV